MESFNEVWNKVCILCKKYVSDVGFRTWLSCMTPVGFEDGEAVFTVRTDFQRDVIIQTYFKHLLPTFEEILGFPVGIRIVVEEEIEESGLLQPGNKFTLDDYLNSSYNHADYDFTFDTFIVGASNKFAHAASLAVSNNPGGAYNPLFIHGNSGLGKTHLLLAVALDIKKNMPNFNIIYKKGDQFTNEFIKALTNNTTAEFRERYREADVLLMDDIQFISGKESTQTEFFHTFDTLYQNKKQIVLTCDRPPRELQSIDDRILTRFEWGLIADIQPPELETRVAIIRRKAQLLDLEIPEDVALYIAEKLKTNIRQLEGTVKKLKAHYTLDNQYPSLSLAQNAIRDVLSDQKPLPITVERIIEEAARTFGVSTEEIRSKKRTSQISQARQVAIYVIREVTQMPMASIGQEFGGRDHTTVLYTLDQVELKMKNDSSFKGKIADIIKNVQQV